MNQVTRVKNRFTDRFRIRYPFVNAAMAFVGSTSELPVAVLNAGGMGTLAIGALTPENVCSEVEAIRRSAVCEPLNINAIVPFTTEQHIDVLCELAPRVVSFHWGPVHPQWIERLHAGGIEVWQQVGSAEQAEAAVLRGIDTVIAQGIEAGGHNLSTLPLFVLLPEVIKAVAPAMVIAAGGISSGRQLAAALALGADAVWVGSRLIASEEAYAHPVYKQKVVDTISGSDTALSSVFGPEAPDFNPMRSLSNELTDWWARQRNSIDEVAPERVVLGGTKLNGQLIPVDQYSSFPPTPDTYGEVRSMAMCCGQGAGLIDSIDSVASIMTTMMDEACQTLQDLYPCIES